MLISLAPLLWTQPAWAWSLSLPPGEDPAAWATVVEEAGGSMASVGGEGAELRLRADPWRIEVGDRVVPVAAPRNAAERADLVFLALSLRGETSPLDWGEVPEAPPVVPPAAASRPAAPAPPVPEVPVEPELPVEPEPQPVAVLPPEPTPPPLTPPPVPPPDQSPPDRPPPDLPPQVSLALSASLLGDPTLASAAHLRAGLAVDPAAWARLELAALATTRRAHDADRTQEEAGVGLRLAHLGGPLSVALGLDLRARSFREEGALVERGLIPVGEVGLAWRLPGTRTTLGLDLGRDLRGVTLFEGEEALETLPPWTLRIGLGVALPLQARTEQDETAETGDRASEVMTP